MKSEIKLLSGAMVMLGLSTSALVVLPYLQVHDAPPSPGLKPYTRAELRGREVYIANGCLYCHSQQPRARAMAPDAARGWGRATVAGDYAYDAPHLLGTMRTGPDLMNIGVRQPSAQWQLGHLYQPRAYVPGSIMPSYPFLFDTKAQAEAGDVVLQLPPGHAPAGQVVVARPEALDLVKYLQSLDRSYPVLPARAAAGPAPQGDRRAVQ
ncbi:MAG: cbb3-type cytochrome c oxidase subunit II [Burkholderiales bacterium]|nr:cbb3-type cytochrome c oxidase subunit II [Burkholderiales bacterium]